MAREWIKEVSYAQRVERPADALAVTMTLVIDDNQAYRRVCSVAVPGYCEVVPCDGDALEYERRLLEAKRAIADHDARYEGG